MERKATVGIVSTFIRFLMISITFNMMIIQPAYASPPSSPQATGSPTSPPAFICGNPAILTGPSTQPPGSIAINTSQNIESIVNTAPAGTTFWIEYGIHYLSPGIYGQLLPKTGDTFIGAPGAIIDGQHYNNYAFTAFPPGIATNVTIEYLTIQNFGAPYASLNEGEVNQGSQSGWKILYNTIRDNDGAGVFDDTHDNVSYNCLTQNGQYGFQAGGHNYTLSHNEISWNDMDKLENLPDPYTCGCSGGGKMWLSGNGIVTYDYVHDNFNVGLWPDTDNYAINISNDYISNNWAEAIIYEASYNAKISHDTLIENVMADGPTGAVAGFPDAAVYISESGGDKRVSNVYYNLNITNNTFIQKFDGVVLYENSNRKCDDGSEGGCTLGNTAVANNSTCNNIPNLASTNPTLYWSCRWRTMNVTIANNYFFFNKTQSSCGLSTSTWSIFCGMNGLFSEDGQPGPYVAERIPWNITYLQNNHFNNNTYVGNWMFDPYNQGDTVNSTIWQGKKIWNPTEGGAQGGQLVNQDVNSIFFS